MQYRFTFKLVFVGIVAAFLCSVSPMFGVEQPQEALTEEQVDIDIDDLLQEINQPVRGKEYVGTVLWLPVEFFEFFAQGKMTDEEKAPLREYTVFLAVVGKMTPLGVTFVPSDQLRSHMTLRDSNGTEYSPLDSAPAELQMMAAVMKAAVGQLLGQMGESAEMYFFPGRNRDGEFLADPKQKGNFAVLIREVAGPGESTYEWRLPLTSLLPPKFCPEGGEKVKADWNYCPWHGVPLTESEPRGLSEPKPREPKSE